MGEVPRESSSMTGTEEDSVENFNVLIKVHNDLHKYRSSMKKKK